MSTRHANNPFLLSKPTASGASKLPGRDAGFSELMRFIFTGNHATASTINDSVAQLTSMTSALVYDQLMALWKWLSNPKLSEEVARLDKAPTASHLSYKSVVAEPPVATPQSRRTPTQTGYRMNQGHTQPSGMRI